MNAHRINLARADGPHPTSIRLRFEDAPSEALAVELGVVARLGARRFTRGTFDVTSLPLVLVLAHQAGVEVVFPVPEGVRPLGPPVPGA
jgi:hypothetical protein